MENESFNFNTILKVESMDKIELLIDEKIKEELVNIAEKSIILQTLFHNWNEVSVSLSLWIMSSLQRIIGFGGLFGCMMRLKRLTIRLQDDGLYVDS